MHQRLISHHHQNVVIIIQKDLITWLKQQERTVSTPYSEKGLMKYISSAQLQLLNSTPNPISQVQTQKIYYPEEFLKPRCSLFRL